MNSPAFRPINLDDLSTDPREFEEVARVLKLLARYAELRALTIGLHGKDDAGAVMYERQLDGVFGSLPMWARW